MFQIKNIKHHGGFKNRKTTLTHTHTHRTGKMGKEIIIAEESCLGQNPEEPIGAGHQMVVDDLQNSSAPELLVTEVSWVIPTSLIRGFLQPLRLGIGL